MKWVTRERPKTDRIACPWLIKNFIDREAEFLYVPADEVLESAEREGAHSYDAPDAEYTHRDGLCSFEVLVEEYKLDDPALAAAGADRPRRRRRRGPRRDAAVAWPARGRRRLPPARAGRPSPARAVVAGLRRALRLVQARGRRGVSLVRAGFVAVPAGRERRVRSRRHLPGRTADVRRAHRRRPRRRDRLRAARVPAFASGPARRRRRLDRRGARPAVHERPRRRAGERLPLLRRTAARPRRPSVRTRTGSPTTGRRQRLIRSTSASRSARTAQPRSSTSTRWSRSPRSRCRAGRAGPSTTPSAMSCTRISASRHKSLVIDADARPIEAHRRCRPTGPHGLWLDRGRLFCAADGGDLVVLDRDSGEVASEPAAAGRAGRDHARPRAPARLRRDRRPRRRLQLRQSTSSSSIEIVETEPGAHTCGWDADGRCLYVFCPERVRRAGVRGARLSRTRAGSSPSRPPVPSPYGLGSVLIGVTRHRVNTYSRYYL